MIKIMKSYLRFKVFAQVRKQNPKHYIFEQLSPVHLSSIFEAIKKYEKQLELNILVKFFCAKTGSEDLLFEH
jgi:hypothetical protein